MKQRTIWAALLLFLFSCSNDPQQQKSGGTAPAGVWAQYKAWADEGDSVVTCLLQFYTDAEMQQTLLLAPPSGVQLDGQPLTPDSAGIVGAFYEYQAPLAQFAGKHRVQFTDVDQQAHVDTFSFYPFRLAAEMPAEVTQKDLQLAVQGLPEESRVRVVLTDTSAAGIGVNEVVQVEGKLLLPAHFWEGLAAGPIVVHLTAEQERPLSSRLRGSMLITYGLSRVVELRK